MTNAEKIRNLDDMSLAKLMRSIVVAAVNTDPKDFNEAEYFMSTVDWLSAKADGEDGEKAAPTTEDVVNQLSSVMGNNNPMLDENGNPILPPEPPTSDTPVIDADSSDVREVSEDKVEEN